MPVFDFKCKSCGEVEEIRIQSTKDPNPPCKKCSTETERLFAPTNLIAYYKQKGAYYGD